jgi:hypothetical protein
MGVVHRWRVRSSGYGNAGATFKLFGADLCQLSHICGAADPSTAHKRPPQVIGPVFQPLQVLNEDGNNVLRRDAATMPHMKAFGENPMDRTHRLIFSRRQ